MSTMSRINRPGPQRRCPPCPACGEDAMRQYGAKHHGLVSRYFYACQHCQHTDVWREVQDGAKYFERLRVPLVEPKPEQCRFEVSASDSEYSLKQAQDSGAVKNIFSSSGKESLLRAAGRAEVGFCDAPRSCDSCARYFPEDALCLAPEELLRDIGAATGMVLAHTELPVQADKITDCNGWTDARTCDRFRLLRLRQPGRP